MKLWDRARIVALALAMALGASGVIAQQPDQSRDLVEGIIEDVIQRTVEAAREQVRRNTGVDLLKRGYVPGRTHAPAPADASREVARELHRLGTEHDRTIARLEQELRRKLDKAGAEFEREAGKEDKPEKIAEKRVKLQDKVGRAYATFEEKIAEENARFDEKRSAILNRKRGG